MKYEILSLQEGLKNASEETWSELRGLAVIVQHKHYPKAHQSEDLISEALLAACESILLDKEKGNYRNLRSYVYTVMRNTMSNTLYHSMKELSLEDISNLHAEMQTEDRIEIPKGRIDMVLDQMPSEYQKHRPALYEALTEIYNGAIPEGTNDSSVDKLLTLVLWSIKEGVERDGS